MITKPEIQQGKYNKFKTSGGNAEIWPFLDHVETLMNADRKRITNSIAYIPTDPQLCFSGLWETVGRELEMLSRVHSFEIENLLKKLPISHLLERHYSALSGGESILIAITLGLITGSSYWVLDRSFEWLDSKIIQWCRQIFLEELSRGSTVIEIYRESPKLLLDANNFSSVLENKTLNTLLTNTFPDGEQNAKLVFSNIQASYGSEFSIGPISIALPIGRTYPMLGKNGAGKTTFALASCGLIASDGVSKITNGKFKSKSPLMCYSFQNPDRQIFRNTVFKEVSELAKRFGTYSEVSMKDILEILELDNELYLDPFALSLSRRRTVATAAVLASGADVVFLDEPTAFLSAREVERLRMALFHVSGKGMTTIAITHNQVFANSMNKTQLLMENGQLEVGSDDC